MKTAAQRQAFYASQRKERERRAARREYQRNGGLLGAVLNVIFGAVVA